MKEIVDIVVTWTWDSYHTFAAVCVVLFGGLFIWIIWDSFFKKKNK